MLPAVCRGAAWLQAHADPSLAAAYLPLLMPACSYIIPSSIRPTSFPTQGVGSATASAALEAFDPSVPFTSDEAMLAALNSKDYTGAPSAKQHRFE